MKKLDLTPEERLERRREKSRRAYRKARELGKPYAYRGNSWWWKLSPEERKIKQKERNIKRRAKFPNKSKEDMRKWREIHGEEERRKAQDYRRNNKKLAIEYLGGKCIRCSGVFHPDVYDFHHKDTNEKDICVARLLNRKFHLITGELDKCILLCANCHRIEHAQY